jgi:hypothetical protein
VVLGNGMPLRPDFSVFVNDDQVRPRLAVGAFVHWRMDEPKVREQLQADWKEAVRTGEVSGDPVFVTDPDSGVPAVQLPHLGYVHADVNLFRESLLKGRAADIDRSYGFFVMVRGRLLNQDDPLLLLHAPSYGTFYRSQFVLHADGLDQDLLADRERVQHESPKTRELAVLQAALYRAARRELTERDETTALARCSESLLPVESRENFQDPMTALMLAREAPVAPGRRGHRRRLPGRLPVRAASSRPHPRHAGRAGPGRRAGHHGGSHCARAANWPPGMAGCGWWCSSNRAGSSRSRRIPAGARREAGTRRARPGGAGRVRGRRSPA